MSKSRLAIFVDGLKGGRTLRLELVAGLMASAVLAAPVGAHPIFQTCPPDSVKAGSTCVDTYEASVWSIPATETGLINKVKKGRATLADLAAGGATQVSLANATGFCSPSFPSTFDVTGNWTTPLYAVSVAGVTPTACISWFQAEQACALSDKRLVTNQEWQRAAAGTPDPGTDNGSTDCNIGGAGPVNAGSRTACVSNWGAFDMVGNVYEWVGEWGDLGQSPGCSNWGGSFGSDLACVGGDGSSGFFPGAFIRGGFWGGGMNAGVFAVDLNNVPLNIGGGVGFRCAR